MSAAGPAGSKVAGIGLLIVAVILFAGQDISIKYVSPYFPVLFLVWCRYASNLLLSVGHAFAVGELRPGLMRTANFRLQVGRSLLLVVATILNFTAVRYLSLSVYVTIFFIYPLIIAALAPRLLGERLPASRWWLIAAGMVGVIIVMRPGTDHFSWPMLLVLGSATAFALYSMATRRLATTDRVLTTNMYTALAGTVVLAPSLVLLAGDWQTDANAWQWALALFSGMPFAGLAHILLVQAHRYVSAPELAPWFYTQILWMSLGSYLVFGDLPDIYTIIGCALIISGCLLVLRIELRAARQAAAANVAGPTS